MDLQSFSSIFELFATFALAYIVIDEFAENPFIATISGKILRKYSYVDNKETKIGKDIDLVKNSINELYSLNFKNDQLREELPHHEKRIYATEKKYKSAFKLIREEIRRTYITRVFSHLNCFIFFYCLILLFYGGVYSSNSWYKTDVKVGPIFMARVDSSLFYFVLISYLFVGFGWFFDKTQKMGDDKSFNFFERLYKGISGNGYLVAFWICVFAGVLGSICFFRHWKVIPVQSEFWHNLVVISAIILPLLNFLIYVLKASTRANTVKPHIQDSVGEYESDFIAEIAVVQNYINAVSYIQSSKIGVSTDEVDISGEDSGR